MNRINLLFISILFLLFIQGCGGENSKQANYPTALGDGVSVTTTDENAVMAPNTLTLKDIGSDVAKILKTNLMLLNTKEAIVFEKEMNYCDISGMLESENLGNLKKLNTISNYQYCKSEDTVQNGKIKMHYEQMDNNGKYPKIAYLTSLENYTFNKIELKKSLEVESQISYKSDKSIKSIYLKINGNLNYNHTNYTLQNITQTINL